MRPQERPRRGVQGRGRHGPHQSQTGIDFHFYLLHAHEVGITDPFHRPMEKAGDLLKVTRLVSLRGGAACGPV